MTWLFSAANKNAPSQNTSLLDDELNSEEMPIEESIVRETIQNALDAKLPGQPGPVIVGFSFVSQLNNKFNPDNLWSGLSDHLLLAGNDTNKINWKNPSFLVISDKNTTGLTGNYDERYTDGNWNGFFWNVGSSQKSGKFGGRRGVGRHVFTIASEVRSFFALTKRIDDHQKLLMGYSNIGVHYNKERTFQYEAIGHYAQHSEGKIAQPFTDLEWINSFSDALEIQQNESGSTFVVPFPVAEITKDTIKKYILKSYYLMIKFRRLVIRINAEEITHDNLVEHMKSVFGDTKENWKGYFDFLDDWETIPEKNKFEVAKNCVFQDEIKKENIEPDRLAELRARFISGDIVVIRLPVFIKKKDKEVTKSYLEAALQKTADGLKGKSSAIRGDMPVINEGNLGSLPAFGFLYTVDDELVELLGDAENASHTHWNSRMPALKKKYADYSNAILFCKRALLNAYSILSSSEDEEDEITFAGFFPMPDITGSIKANNPNLDMNGDKDIVPDTPEPESEDVTDQNTDNDDLDQPNPDMPPIPLGRKPIFDIVRKGTGFQVLPLSSVTDEDFPSGFKVMAAYTVDEGAGNPFTVYSKFDFDFSNQSKMKIEADNADIKIANENILMVRVESKEFSITVQGFDTNRDLTTEIALIDLNEVV